MVQDFGESDGKPHCAADAFMPDDLKAISTNRPDDINAMIEKERSCSKFVPLAPGRSAGWHQDKAVRLEIQKRDEEREEKGRKWQFKLLVYGALSTLIVGLINLTVGVWLGRMMNPLTPPPVQPIIDQIQLEKPPDPKPDTKLEKKAEPGK
jgi:hypothetical protein